MPNNAADNPRPAMPALIYDPDRPGSVTELVNLLFNPHVLPLFMAGLRERFESDLNTATASQQPMEVEE